MKKILKLVAAPVVVVGAVAAASVVGSVVSVLIEAATRKDFEASYTESRQG